MTARQEYLVAVQNAEAKKESFLANAQIARARVSPSRLKNDAKAKISHAVGAGRDKAKDTAQTYPVAVGFAGVGIVAYLFRRPICRLSRRLWVRLKTPTEPVGIRADLRERMSEFRNALSRSITEFRHEK